MKKLLKILSVIMSIVMFLGVFSAANPTLAAEIQENDEHKASAEKILEELLFDSANELVEERDKYTKVYKTTQGTKKAIISSTPIHYEEDGNWCEIDNTLIESSNEEFYTNTDNFFEVEIPKELTADSQISIENDDFTLSFELIGTDIFDKKNKSKAKKIDPVKDENSSDYYISDKIQSGLVFEDVGDDTSIEYCVTSTGIKENIILDKKPKEEVKYSYNITANNLTATLNDDKSVSFTNSQGEVVFKIPAPVMYDRNSDSSQDINVALTGEKGKYVLEYKPSFDWLKKEAKYPVVIDPVIEVNNDNYGIVDTSVLSTSPTLNSGSDVSLCVGNTSEGTELISYIDIVNNYYFNNGLAIKNALLYLYTGYILSSGDSSKIQVVAYPVIDEWNENTVTYNDKPDIDTDVILDMREYTRDSSGKYEVYDVTEAFASNTTKYNGIALKTSSTSSTSNDIVAFTSSEYSESTNKCPYFVIEYYETQGVEEQFDYHIQNAGRAGTVYYNDYSNQIYIERDEPGIQGLKMPVQIKRYYNSNVGGSLSLYNLAFYGGVAYYGFGWKTNFNQTIEYAGLIDGKEYILYNNDQGQTVYFEKSGTIENNQRKWIEVADVFSTEKGYELWLNTSYESNLSVNFGYATIKDSQNQTYEFNQYGFLTKINSGEENSDLSISVSYNNNYSINKIVDGAGREYRFSYTEDVLTSIQAFSANGNAVKVIDANNNSVNYKYTYTYTDANINGMSVPVLSTVTYPDGEKVYYTVTDNFTSVKNIDGYTLEYEFSGAGNCTISEKVYPENSTDATLGGSLNVTRVNAYEKIFNDANNVSQTKQFDLYGRTISIINNDGTIVSRAFSDTMMSCGTLTEGLYVDYDTDYAVEGNDIVTDGSFDTGLSAWVVSDSSKIVRDTDTDADSNTEISGSMALVGDIDQFLYAIQTIEVPDGVSGDGYHFSFSSKNFKTHNVDNLAYSSGIIVEARTEDGAWETVTRLYPNPFNDNWQKNSCEFEIDFEYDGIRLFVVHICQYGIAWFDDFSLINTYRPDSSSSSDTGADSETSTGCSCTYCEDNCNCNHDGTTVCTPESCPECGKCSCSGCMQTNCVCRDCSDDCDKVSCNRNYSYSNTSEGSFFSISDGEKEMSVSQNVSGNYYSSQKDMNGINTFYDYNQTNGQLRSITDGNDYVTSYSYDAMNHLKNISTTVSDLSSGNKMSTAYVYDDDRIQTITHNGFSYNYEYDAWGNVSAVKVGQQSLVSYNYDNGINRNRVNTITYGNGDYVNYTYDNSGNITSVKNYSADNTLTADYEYTYDTNGIITVIRNNKENSEIRYGEDETTIVLLNGNGEADDVLLYSTGLNENEEYVEILGGLSYTKGETEATADAEKGTTTTNSSLSGQHTVYNFTSTSDYFGRQNQKSVSTKVSQTNVAEQYLNVQTAFNYKDLSADETTTLVSSYNPVVSMQSRTAEGVTLSNQTLFDWEYLYTYDTNGNITNISVNIPEEEFSNLSICDYIYDEAGQLVRENNAYTEKSYVYVYDKGGNITQKIEYEYSDAELGAPVSTVDYTYDSVWTDKLTAYGDTEIETDSIGNPLNLTSVDFLGQNVNATLEWNGRQLASATVDETRYEYTYDSEGMRTRMAVYDVETNALMTSYYYVWESGKLRGYTVTDGNGVTENTVKMLFDINDDSVGYELYSADDDTTKTFFFLKNLQGDITNVYNENGEDVLQYAYDAWGNVTVLLDKSSFEDINKSIEAAVYTPITYRGYSYDYYTGLYYLQSRYYNPLYGRFLNMDDTSILEKTSGTVHGANLFAYCNNDPIQLIDPKGELGDDTATMPRPEQEGGGAIGFWVILVLVFIFVVLVALFTVLVNMVVGVLSWLKELITQVVSDVQHKLGIDVPETLEGQMERAKVKANERGRTEKTNVHHIVAKGARKAKPSRDILEGCGMTVNDPANLVVMNREVHWYLHTTLYHTSVCEYLKAVVKGDEKNSVKVRAALWSLGAKLAIL